MAGHGLRIEVTNDSDHTFILDGECFRAGRWGSGRQAPISARACTEIQFSSSSTRGVSGVAWWVDNKDHTTYLSMAFSCHKLRAAVLPPTFACWAGLPPANLKAELEKAGRLAKGVEVASENDLRLLPSCRWKAREVGTVTVVEVRIFPELLSLGLPGLAGPCAPTKLFADDTPAGGLGTPSTRSLTPTGALLGNRHVEVSGLARLRARSRPKDVKDGLVKGAKALGMGLAAGTVAPWAVAVHHGREGGALGFAKGLGLGVLGGAACTVGGATASIVQVARGLKHAPQAFRSRREERTYDRELGLWVDVDLCALERAAAEEELAEEAFASAAAGRARETELYELLRVAPAAGQAELRRAYCREARQCQPDDFPGDDEAIARFRSLTHAYQVLSDPEARRAYDRCGKAGIEDRAPSVDAGLFFGLLFGSERFLDYTGELNLAMWIRRAGGRVEVPQDVGRDELAGAGAQRRQARREVRCACFLREKLAPWVLGRQELAFEEQLYQEAADLARLRFGPELLLTLGRMYRLRAEIYLVRLGDRPDDTQADELNGRYSIPRRAAAVKRGRHRLRQRLDFYCGAAGGLMGVAKITAAGRRADQAAERGAAPEERQAHGRAVREAAGDALPRLLKVAWAAIVRDIDATVTQASRKLLLDKSVPWQLRVRRAQALHLLGEIFTEEGLQAQSQQDNAGLAGVTSEIAQATIAEAFAGVSTCAS